MGKREKTKQAQTGAIHTAHSVRTKIIVMLVVAMTLMSTMLCIIFAENVKSHLQILNKNYLYDLTVSYGKEIQQQINMQGYETVTDYDHLDKMLGGIGLKDVSSSYAYLVSADGTMLYHPTAEKVGAPVENEAITEIVQQLKAGTVPEPAVVEYSFQGEMNYAAYYITEGKECILVISADRHEVFKDITEVTLIGIISAAILVISAIVIGYMVISKIVKPIIKVTEVVGRFAKMDFTAIEEEGKLTQRKDETGMMSQAVVALRGQIANVVSDLKEKSQQLFQASAALDTNASETANSVGQVEKAVSEIADGATSQAEETQKATENVILMGDMVEETSQEVHSLIENANDMRKLSEEASVTLSELEKVNAQTEQAINVIYEQTNTTNESALRIREATALITSIADETNLLSLNASIEAARAGEQGRGFAVVASQIQKLAEQSNDSARQIENIIDSLISDSEKAVETMSEVREIIKSQSDNVGKTDKIFTQVKGGIAESIEGVGRIAAKTKKLDEARINVVDVVQNLTAIAQENAASTEETSASVTEVSSIVLNISENASQLKDVANGLEENMNIFKM